MLHYFCCVRIIICICSLNCCIKLWNTYGKSISLLTRCRKANKNSWHVFIFYLFGLVVIRSSWRWHHLNMMFKIKWRFSNCVSVIDISFFESRNQLQISSPILWWIMVYGWSFDLSIIANVKNVLSANVGTAPIAVHLNSLRSEARLITEPLRADLSRKYPRSVIILLW